MAHFEYDYEKNETNQKKHGVSFDEAATILSDPDLAIITDADAEEERFIAIGSSCEGRYLFVAHCCRRRGDAEVIRINSARPLTSSERRRLEFS